MSYVLSGTSIEAPNGMQEANETQMAQVRVLSGSIARDYFGSNKRRWTLEYKNKKKSAWDTINTIYQAYLSTGTAVAFYTDETNYTVSSTTVHVDLQTRGFSVQGTDYLSDFTLILTEA